MCTLSLDGPDGVGPTDPGIGLVDVIDALVAADPAAMADEEARQHLLALHVVKARVDAAVVAATGTVDRRLLHRVDGARSAGSWVAARVGEHKGRCAADVRLARALRDVPVVASEFAAGRLTRFQVDLLVLARTDEVADVYAAQEAYLVGEVAGLTAADASRFLRAWLEQARLAVGYVDPDEPPDETHGPAIAVNLNPTVGGRRLLDGEMDAEHGAIIGSALDGEVEAMFKAGVFGPEDGLTPAERRGWALTQIIGRQAKPTVKHGRPRPSVEVIVDEMTLRGVPVTDPTEDDGEDLRRRVCEYRDGSPLPLATLGRLLCGAKVHRIVLGADGEVLDVGKDERFATRAQRRALRRRHDGHCAFPGCDAPDDWCEAHHIEPWDPDPDSPHGRTDMDNLVPLCRYHHDAVHRGGFTLRLEADGTVEVLRPPESGQRRCRVTPTLVHRRTPGPRARVPA